MAKPPSKCKAAECEECPEWIFTFADLVMLMMGFFVILWVLKPAGKAGTADSKDAQEQREEYSNNIEKLKEGFIGLEVDPLSSERRVKQRHLGPKEGAENQTPRETAPGTDREVTSLRPGPVSAVGSRLLFDAGSAGLSPETTHALDEIAEKIRGHYNIIMVKGHTSLDDLPDKSTREQKMDLSLRRAQAAASYLLSKGISPEVLRVQGCSTFEPVHQRAYTAEEQLANRRVEIESMAELIEERQDPANTPGGNSPTQEKSKAAELLGAEKAAGEKATPPKAARE